MVFEFFIKKFKNLGKKSELLFVRKNILRRLLHINMIRKLIFFLLKKLFLK